MAGMTRQPTDEEVFAAMNAVAAWDHLAFADADSYRENIDRFLRHALQGALPLIEKRVPAGLLDNAARSAREAALAEAAAALRQWALDADERPIAADFVDDMRSRT